MYEIGAALEGDFTMQHNPRAGITCGHCLTWIPVGPFMKHLSQKVWVFFQPGELGSNDWLAHGLPKYPTPLP